MFANKTMKTIEYNKENNPLCGITQNRIIHIPKIINAFATLPEGSIKLIIKRKDRGI